VSNSSLSSTSTSTSASGRWPYLQGGDLTYRRKQLAEERRDLCQENARPGGTGKWGKIGADADRDRRPSPCGGFFEHGEAVVGVGQEEVDDGRVGLKFEVKGQGASA
jgi:hypothetical protein